jgi:Uma2 family endonuclease
MKSSLKKDERDTLANRTNFWKGDPMVEAIEPIQIHTRPAWKMNDDQFFEFCRLNGDLRIERNSEGDILIMTPEGMSSGRANSVLSYYFEEWSRRDGTGQVFGSSTGFTLPNGAVRSPDVAWVRNSVLKKVSENDWHRFTHLCPDFVLELRSKTDRLLTLQKKMTEYLQNGARLGWLLDPESRQVYVYKPKAKVKIFDDPKEIMGDPVLRGFRLDVPEIWSVVNRNRL